MSSGGDQHASPTRIPLGDAGTRLLLGSGSALLLVALLDWLQVTFPRAVTLHVESVAVALAMLMGAALTALAFLAFPGLALGCLVGLVAANLSEVLVRFHDMPSLLQLLALPLAFAALVRLPREAPRVFRRPLLLLGVTYLLVVIASTAWAESATIADATALETGRGVMILALVAALAAHRGRFEAALWVLLLTSALVALIGVVQGVTGLEWEFLGLGRIKYAQIYGDVFQARIAGPFGDPNFFAQSLLLVLPLSAALAWTARTTTTRSVAAAAGAAILGGILFTYSRGAVLALGVQAVLALPSLAARHRRAVLASAALALVTLLVLPTGLATRLATIGQLLPGHTESIDPDSSFEKRRVVTTVAWRMFLDNPILGVGGGNYTVHFDRYAGDLSSAGREYLDPDGDRRQYPHNLYLEIGSETGLIGLVVFLALVGGSLLMLTDPVFRSAGDVRLETRARALAVGIVGYLVAALFLHGQFQRTFWLTLGLVSAAYALARRPGRES